MRNSRHPPNHIATAVSRNIFATFFLLLLLILFTLLSHLVGNDNVAHAQAFCPSSTTNDPTAPYVPIDAWIALPLGGSHWYAFRDEGDGSDIQVRASIVPTALTAHLPHGGMNVQILTTAQMLAMQRGDARSVVGAGTPLAALNNDLYWTGNFVQSGIYYVLVESTPLTGAATTTQPFTDNGEGMADPTAGNYMLSIRGADISFPLLSFANPLPPLIDPPVLCEPLPTPAPTLVPTPTSIASTPTSSTVQSSPQAPLSAIGRELSIRAGETHWYAFRDEGDEGQIEIRATARPEGCLTFVLWTPEQLTLWQRGLSFMPVGQGTRNESLDIELFWTGSFVKSGIYYIVVESHEAVAPEGGQASCLYRLWVTGDDISLAPPAYPMSQVPDVTKR